MAGREEEHQPVFRLAVRAALRPFRITGLSAYRLRLGFGSCFGLERDNQQLGLTGKDSLERGRYTPEKIRGMSTDKQQGLLGFGREGGRERKQDAGIQELRGSGIGSQSLVKSLALGKS